MHCQVTKTQPGAGVGRRGPCRPTAFRYRTERTWEQNEMSIVRGVDGCKAGWLCLSLRSGERYPSASVFDVDAQSLLSEVSTVTAIDIPIGLPSTGARRVDIKARRLLGKLKSSVFPVPVRATLAANSYVTACDKSMRACGKKISKQSFSILPRIRNVDTLLRESPTLINSIYEVHPEVSFVHWNLCRPLQHSKKSGFGFMERIKMVEKIYGSSPYRVRAEISRKQATDDDILDAFAALWTAQRIHDGKAVSIIDADERDEFGLPMQIWA